MHEPARLLPGSEASGQAYFIRSGNPRMPHYRNHIMKRLQSCASISKTKRLKKPPRPETFILLNC